MVPSVLPWVPLPLPGAPKRINVLYLIISELRLYSSKGAGSTSLVISSEIEGSRRIIDLEPTGSFDPEGVRGSRRRRDHQRVDVYPPTAAIEPHGTVKQRKNRVVTAQADVFPWRKLRAALAHDDVAGDDHFAAEFFHTQPFADAVAPVLNTALSFFVSHWGKLIIDPPSPSYGGHGVYACYAVTLSYSSAFFAALFFAPTLMLLIFTRVNLRRCPTVL